MLARQWTGRDAYALRLAMRMGIRAFAERTSVAASAVAKWKPGGSRYLSHSTQQKLDALLAQASDEIRLRFEALLGTGPDERPGLTVDLWHASTTHSGQNSQAKATAAGRPLGGARLLYVVVCGARPASEVGTLILEARRGRWSPHLVATPHAAELIDVPNLNALSGFPVRVTYSAAEEPVDAAIAAEAIVVAPATYNTINKLAAGVADNYALALLAECLGTQVPMVIAPYMSSTLAARAQLRESLACLEADGVGILRGPAYTVEANLGAKAADEPFPWLTVLRELSTLVAP